MTDQEICELFDTNINMTMKELSFITGKSIRELKDILLKPNNQIGETKWLYITDHPY
mgnify:FL=1